MKKQTDLFFETFCGEYVEILQDYEVTTSFSLTSEGEPQEMRMPMTVSGFVMDTDQIFLYLSADGEEVNQALPIHTIKHIGIVPEKDSMQDVLDSTDPESNQNYN